MSLDLESLRFGDDGLLPVVVQDVASGTVLMLAYANREAVARTLAEGRVWFWSRSRQSLWCKGETSGNFLRLVSLYADCDRDALLVRVDPQGPTCHRLVRSCFDASSEEAVPSALELGWLDDVLSRRADADPAASYTARLLAAGPQRIARKVGEEATETVIAAVGGGSRDELCSEAGDLIYHLLLLLRSGQVTAADLARELRRRHLEPAAAPSRKPEAPPDPAPAESTSAEETS
ncbi:MAG: bifunctional phosphoribosyl-AMP cyclohydrolase/phosphoribosyl-ATP diphosphatase HisIE [Acidobacteriota bacterium]